MALEYRLELWRGWELCLLCSVTSKYWLVWKYWIYPSETRFRLPSELCNFLSSALVPHPPVAILVSLQVSYCLFSLGTAPITETVIWFLDLRTGVALAKRVECAGYICNQLSMGLHCCEQLPGETRQHARNGLEAHAAEFFSRWVDRSYE